MAASPGARPSLRPSEPPRQPRRARAPTHRQLRPRRGDRAPAPWPGLERGLSGPAGVRHSPDPALGAARGGPSASHSCLWRPNTGVPCRSRQSPRPRGASSPAAGAGMRGKREGQLAARAASVGKVQERGGHGTPRETSEGPWCFRQGREGKGAELWAGFWQACPGHPSPGLRPHAGPAEGPGGGARHHLGHRNHPPRFYISYCYKLHESLSKYSVD